MNYLISQKVSEIFDLYTELHDIRISLFDPQGQLLYPDTEGRPDCRHCRLLRQTLGMENLCRDLDRTMMKLAGVQQEMIKYTCHAGMSEAIVPLFVDSQLAGYVMVGQFRSLAAPAKSPYAGRWDNEQENGLLQQAFTESPVFPEEKIETLLALFRQIVELIISSQLIHPRDYDLIEPIIEQIRHHPEVPLSLEDAARIVGRSPSTVTRLFKKITRQSFKQYQISCRLKRAAREMRENPNLPISKIAEAVGFDDPFYFSRVFRKYTGKAPSDYRKQSGLAD